MIHLLDQMWHKEKNKATICPGNRKGVNLNVKKLHTLATFQVKVQQQQLPLLLNIFTGCWYSLFCWNVGGEAILSGRKHYSRGNRLQHKTEADRKEKSLLPILLLWSLVVNMLIRLPRLKTSFPVPKLLTKSPLTEWLESGQGLTTAGVTTQVMLSDSKLWSTSPSLAVKTQYDGCLYAT